MLLEGWGRHPIIESDIQHPPDTEAARALLLKGPALIAHGMGRSYGDSALAPRALKTDRLNLLLGFDPETGILRCQAGVSLDEILRDFVPRGWFLHVTPGTKYVSVGGAIASDVHGKSHHATGCFSEAVLDFDLLTGSGDVLRCSRETHPELFSATCGGMGLTGVILRAALRLKSVRSAYFDQVTYKAAGLDEILDLFKATGQATYSVAWIDCRSRGAGLGRSILTVGEHSEQGPLRPHGRPLLDVPLVPPLSPVQPFTMELATQALYHKVLRKESRTRIHYEPFLYPLDKIGHWNRMYGKGGFTQYQFVLPTEAGARGRAR